MGSAYRSSARAFFTGSLSSSAFASALGSIWKTASQLAESQSKIGESDRASKGLSYG